MNENSENIKALTDGERKDLRILSRFTHIYCRARHRGDRQPMVWEGSQLPDLGSQREKFCPECRDFLLYAASRRLRCPLDPKPKCKDCHVHCYRPGHRERVREIMRFSGKYMIRRGRIDLLWHYFF